MRRVFWLVMGVTIGVLVVRKATRAAEQIKPNHLAQQAGGLLGELSDSFKQFALQVRSGMKERESELREGAGLDHGALGAKPEDFRTGRGA